VSPRRSPPPARQVASTEHVDDRLDAAALVEAVTGTELLDPVGRSHHRREAAAGRLASPPDPGRVDPVVAGMGAQVADRRFHVRDPICIDGAAEDGPVLHAGDENPASATCALPAAAAPFAARRNPLPARRRRAALHRRSSALADLC
jgi:hypothetical protein